MDGTRQRQGWAPNASPRTFRQEFLPRWRLRAHKHLHQTVHEFVAVDAGGVHRGSPFERFEHRVVGAEPPAVFQVVESGAAVVVQRVEVGLAREAEHRAPVDGAGRVLGAGVLRAGERRQSGRRRGEIAQIVLVEGNLLGRGRGRVGHRRLVGGCCGRGRRRFVAVLLHFALDAPQRVADEHGAVEAGVGELPEAGQFTHGDVEHR